MRTRFAPSPTGFLHLGGLRTALFNYLLARSTGGAFVLRIEDTDQSRVVPGAVQHLLDTLHWLKLPFDEGPGRVGCSVDYIQSKRLGVYQKYADHLLARKLAYKCFCPKDPSLLPKRYSKRCRFAAEITDHRPFVVRFAAPEDGPLAFTDLNYGQIHSEPIDDIVLIKSDGFPTYHFASVVDDHDMQIDTVMRGQEWLPSTAIHKALYGAFQWEPPSFCHLPLLLDQHSRSKLSKRQDSASVDWYRSQGFLPEALLNFTAFLGWTPSVHYGNREVLSVDELVRVFDLYSLNKADAIVDLTRLRWFNRCHLERQSTPTLAAALGALAEVEPERALKVVELMRSRVDTVQELKASCSYFFDDPAQACSAPDQATLHFIASLHSGLSALERLDEAGIRALLAALKTADRAQCRASMLAARQAITGSTVGPPLTLIMVALGREVVLRRLQRVLNPNGNAQYENR